MSVCSTAWDLEILRSYSCGSKSVLRIHRFAVSVSCGCRVLVFFICVLLCLNSATSGGIWRAPLSLLTLNHTMLWPLGGWKTEPVIVRFTDIVISGEPYTPPMQWCMWSDIWTPNSFDVQMVWYGGGHATHLLKRFFKNLEECFWWGNSSINQGRTHAHHSPSSHLLQSITHQCIMWQISLCLRQKRGGFRMPLVGTRPSHAAQMSDRKSKRRGMNWEKPLKK